MRKTRLLSLLALLMAVVTGARAQSTTHIVKQDNVNTIFNGGGYTLGNAVNAGDVLDFQGTIDLETAPHSLVINKPVNIISSTKDAVLKLHTPAGDRSGKNPGSTFVINADGAGTQVQDIRLENTGMWIFNTSNVTFTGVTFHVEGVPVCSGVGHVALRYSDNVTFDGCTVYTKNNGGNSACALTGSHDCTFKDTHFETAGSAGNVLHIGNPYNTSDMPAGYTMNNDNISVINCTFTAESSGAMSQFKIMDGLRHRIENCTVNFATGFGCTATASEDGHVIRNNTFTQGLSIPKASTVTGNSVTGNVSIYSNNATVSNTTVYLGSTITGNSILGKVTFSNNSKNNTLTRNVITSTGDYAVVMASTADANNTVQYNTLNAATKKGDEAVNPSTGTGNTISNNSNIALMLADGTQDADKWSVKVGEEAAAFPVGGLKGGETITLQYTGRLKVKGVKATSDAAPKWDGDLSKLTAESTAEFATATDGMTITGTLAANVKVSIAAGATVTLDGVTINGVSNGKYKWAGLNCLGNATIVLKDGTTNTVEGFHEDYPGIHVPAGSKLTIQGGTEGTGKLTASPFDGGTDDSYGAGIGGGYSTTCGDIDIQGGDITATGGSNAAGIGGGKTTCGNISIEGGTVTATGGYKAAGIGGGNGGTCGAITITGGTVTATGGYCSAGIGSGPDGTCGAITIANTVTKVTATKGEDASHSIGKGYGEIVTCGTVTIGGTKYWENNAAVNGGDTYLAQATIEYPQAAKEPATVTTAPTGAAIVGVGKTTALVSGGVADGGTLMYAVTTTNTKPTSTDGFSDAVPTAQTITASGTVYVWYYVKGDDTHSDSEIAGPVSVTLVEEITWDVTNVSDLRIRGNSYTKEGVTLSCNGEWNEARWRDKGEENGIYFEAMETGGYTFTAPNGKKFTKIEMKAQDSIGWDIANLGTGWAINNTTITWTGSAASTVGLLTDAGNFNGKPVNSIVFYLVDAE